MRWPSQIDDADGRVTQYCAKFLERVERAACGKFPTRNPKQILHLLIREVQPVALKTEMLRLAQVDNVFEKHVPGLMERLTEEARAFEITKRATVELQNMQATSDHWKRENIGTTWHKKPQENHTGARVGVE